MPETESSAACKKCKIPCENLEDFIKCCECCGLFHPECTKIRTMNKFVKLAEQKKASWKCDECTVETSSTTSNRESESAILEAINQLNKKMDNHYSGLKAKMDENSTSLKKLQETVDSVKKEHVSLKQECSEIRQQTSSVSDECRRLQREVRELQQYTRRENIEIAGIPVTAGEDVYAVLECVAKAMKIFFSRSEVSVAHRVPVSARGRDRHPPIVVRFVSRTSREAWLAASRADKTKRLTTKDINPNLALGSVFINEHLSPYNKMLLSRGKELVRTKKLDYAWTRDGKVLIKRPGQEQAVRVWVVEDFKV